MVNLGVEAGGLGISAQAGPLMTGAIYAEGPGWGLQSGGLGHYTYGDLQAVVVGYKASENKNRQKGSATAQVAMIANGMVLFGGKNDRCWYALGNVGARINFGLGVHAGMHVFEVADFLLGWLNIDLLGDDSAAKDLFYIPAGKLEKAWMTPSDELILQIAGRYTVVSVSELIKGAEKSTYHREPNAYNVLLGGQFHSTNNIDKAVLNCRPIPIGTRDVNPMYSTHWDHLGYNHSELVKLPEDVEYMLFPLCYATERYHRSLLDAFGTYHRSILPDNYGHSVSGYALMRNKPFSHGLDWLIIYLIGQ